MSEHDHQRALFAWAALQTKKHPELRLLFAVPLGGARSKATAGRFKAEGVRAGVPDIVLPVARGNMHALWIELKRPRGPGAPAGRETKEQAWWRKELSEEGHHAVVCYGWEEARAVIEWYLEVRDGEL